MVRGFKNPNTMYMAIECIVCDVDAQLCIIERKKNFKINSNILVKLKIFYRIHGQGTLEMSA